MLKLKETKLIRILQNEDLLKSSFPPITVGKFLEKNMEWESFSCRSELFIH